MTVRYMIEQPTSQTEQQSQLDAAKRRVQELLIELKILAKTETDQNLFLSQVLSRTLETTAASGAMIWHVKNDMSISAVAEAGTTIHTLELASSEIESHARLIKSSVATGQSMAVDPNTRAASDATIANESPFLLLVHPLSESVSDRRFAIELYQRPEVNAAARSGYLRFLNEIGDIFIYWFARSELRRQAAENQKSIQSLDFIRDVHSSLDPREVAYTAANDGRVLIDSDRLSVLSFDGRRAKVLSVSGQDDFDNRSNVVQKQQRMATILCRNPQTVWLCGAQPDLPRGLQRSIDDYQNESHARTLVMTPLLPSSPADPEGAIADQSQREDKIEPVGVMVAEWFAVDVTRQEREFEIQMISDNVGRALANAKTHRSIFLLPLWTTIGKWRWLVQAKTLPKTITALITLVVLIAFFAFYPYPFDMRVDGWLQPIEKSNVYANIEGVVNQVHVRHGQVVNQGDLLLELRNDELQYQLTSAIGQLQQIEEEIITAQASALMESDDTNQNQVDIAAARLGGLREKKLSVVEQLGLLRKMEEKLKIFSPINGTVVSWDPVRQLTQRPVSREDVVLVIADVKSNWEIELYIPERKYGHVMSGGEKPDITFFAATDPQLTFKGKITGIEGHASEHEGFGSSVRAIATFDQANAPELYVGAAVTAKIHCGTCSIGYAWFHELIEFVQSRLLF